MDRNVFLKLAQKASALEYDKTKKELFVEYNGTYYFPHSYEIGFLKGVPIYRAVLRDLNCCSVLSAQLEKVKEAKL